MRHQTKVSNLLNDEELMLAYQDGSFEAFNILYKRYHKKVYSYVFSRIKNKSTSEEIQQNIYLKHHNSRFNYNSKYKYPQWLFTITRSELIDHFRKHSKKIETNLFDENFSKNSQQDFSADTPSLEDYDFLSHKEKEAIHLRYIEESDYEEISLKLNSTLANTRKIISNGLKKIRQKLGSGESNE